MADHDHTFIEIAAAEGEALPPVNMADDLESLAWAHRHFTLYAGTTGHIHLHCNVGEPACFRFEPGIDLGYVASFASDHFLIHLDDDRMPAGPLSSQEMESYLLPHRFVEEAD